ncbi:hypothetical protein GJT82_01005 [Enterobacteriaceae endosymbiont of Plateumaris rustica]|nr:hypothetical protein GJT82_01005 [Enterobacteriaceae endosymbiont of Plateumaris rustica]
MTILIDNKNYLLVINKLKCNNNILLNTKIKLAQKAFYYILENIRIF